MACKTENRWQDMDAPRPYLITLSEFAYHKSATPICQPDALFARVEDIKTTHPKILLKAFERLINEGGQHNKYPQQRRRSAG